MHGSTERDTNCRFAPGNPGGPGRPRQGVESDYLTAQADACPLEMWRVVCSKAVAGALEGDPKAREWLSRYVLGTHPATLLDAAVIESAAGSEILIQEQASAIREQRVGRIAIGKLTVISGDPGLGKSFLSLHLAARVSIGCQWPDDCGHAPLGSVVLLSAEADLADTIRPRLDAAGADVTRIVALQAVRGSNDSGTYGRPFDLSRDVARLEEAVVELGDCRVVVIDPISCYLGKTKSHDNSEARGVLAPLAELAGRLGVAAVAVSHLRQSEGPAVMRTMGSHAFVVAARAAYVAPRGSMANCIGGRPAGIRKSWAIASAVGAASAQSREARVLVSDRSPDSGHQPQGPASHAAGGGESQALGPGGHRLRPA